MAKVTLETEPLCGIPTKRQPELRDAKEEADKSSREVAWYQDTLRRVPETAVEIFRNYCGIPDAEVVNHILQIREQAWDIFLDFAACLSPIYPEVLARLRTGEQTLLDLGCCFGQDIRKLVYDGAPPGKLVGVEKDARFLELGYHLFGDRERLEASLRVRDVFEPDFLADLRGKVDIVFVGSFLHLFGFEEQKVIVAQLVKLLRRRRDSVVFGRHLGTTKEGGMFPTRFGPLYHHSSDTIGQLWATAEDGDWHVSSTLVEYGSVGWDNGVQWREEHSDVRQQYFSARRID